MSQDEERDSFDKEWDNAYAAMDLISHLGWANRCEELDLPAAHLLRNVFIATDVIHEEARFQMEDNSHLGDQNEGIGIEDWMCEPTDTSSISTSTDYDNLEGKIYNVQSCLCLFIIY